MLRMLQTSLQAKLSVSHPGDRYEQEAERVSSEVMRMPEPATSRTPAPVIQRLGTGLRWGAGMEHLNLVCDKCEKDLQRNTAPTHEGPSSDPVPPQAEAKVGAIGGGQPLPAGERAFFEPRFGVDFSQVRIHHDGSADAAARSVGALAFTRGSNIVFRTDQYRPETMAGRQLLAHELTHVVQQGSARDSGLGVGVATDVVQRYPGDGMVPPGDCGWAEYLLLRGSVETAKAVVSMLGACSAGDSCLFLATKIAAITAEIAARVALDATCFKGGDAGHRQQVQDKVNMMNRCYQFFQNSNCSPELIAAMALVVEKAREVIAEAALAAVLVVLAALIAAIIALIEVIAAAAAAAAEATVIAEAAAAIIALLRMLANEISPAGI
jgi:hypothetical protein